MSHLNALKALNNLALNFLQIIDVLVLLRGGKKSILWNDVRRETSHCSEARSLLHIFANSNPDNKKNNISLNMYTQGSFFHQDYHYPQ